MVCMDVCCVTSIPRDWASRLDCVCVACGRTCVSPRGRYLVDAQEVDRPVDHADHSELACVLASVELTGDDMHRRSVATT